MRLSSIFSLLFLVYLHGCQALTYYDYYAPGGGVDVGLVAEGNSFTLNNKEIVILSGTFHYFRVHPQYWRDTLRKLRAAGLNTVETYVPWNLHEPYQGIFDFGNLGEDMSMFLDVHSFIQMAKEEDLFVILRPGPFICAEWEFGGMPSWLLRDEEMKVRVFYEGFTGPVLDYFNYLLPLVADLQFTKGGPIIAVQIENEYGGFGNAQEPPGKQYLELLKYILTDNGYEETLYVTSDGSIAFTGPRGSLEGVLMTANFKNNPNLNLDALKQQQPDRPLMVMEYWTGWFDHWLESNHSTFDPQQFGTNLEKILLHNSSVNMYMFIGGTSFGFMAGGNTNVVWPFHMADVSNYDYDAPLSEAGDYTEKYTIAKDTIAKYNPLEGIVDHPVQPLPREKTVYPSVSIDQSLDFHTILSQQTNIETDEGPMSMEHLPINNNSGQSYGYVVYTTHADLTQNSTLFITGHVRDMAQVLVDGELITKPYSGPEDISGFGFWHGKDKDLTLPGKGQVAEVTIMVENVARVNFGSSQSEFHQRKGLWEGPVLIDGFQIDQWDISPLELKSKQVGNLTGWLPYAGSLETPAMYRSTFSITGEPNDTYLDMSSWNKGVVLMNGFNLGRYWKVGPAKTLYVPAPLMNEGVNEIIAFEQYTPGPEFVFTDVPILG